MAGAATAKDGAEPTMAGAGADPTLPIDRLTTATTAHTGVWFTGPCITGPSTAAPTGGPPTTIAPCSTVPRIGGLPFTGPTIAGPIGGEDRRVTA